MSVKFVGSPFRPFRVLQRQSLPVAREMGDSETGGHQADRSHELILNQRSVRVAVAILEPVCDHRRPTTRTRW